MTHAQLKAFHAVAQCGSFSRAAALLSLTQPAISDHVRKLEEAHGIQLFLRASHGISLTGIGRKLYAITERQFETEAQAAELLNRAQTLEEGQLTIGADAAVHILPQLARFTRKHPRIAVRLTSGNSTDLIARLLNFSIDIAVTAERPQNDAVGFLKLREDRLVLVAAKGSDAASHKSITFSSLGSATLIMREEGSATRKLLLDEMRRRDLKIPNPMEIEGREAVCEAVAQGLGVAIMSLGEVVNDSRLRVVQFSDWTIHMEEWLLYLHARSELHLIKSFLKQVAN